MQRLYNLEEKKLMRQVNKGDLALEQVSSLVECV